MNNASSKSLREKVKSILDRFKPETGTMISVVVPFSISTTSRKKVARLDPIDPTDLPNTGNEVLDLYLLEGMKLFHQGPYAKQIKSVGKK